MVLGMYPKLRRRPRSELVRNVSFQMRTRTKGETYINIFQNIYMEELIHCAHTARERWMTQRRKRMMI